MMNTSDLSGRPYDDNEMIQKEPAARTKSITLCEGYQGAFDITSVIQRVEPAIQALITLLWGSGGNSQWHSRPSSNLQLFRLESNPLSTAPWGRC